MRCTGTRRKSSWSSWTSEKCSEKNVAKSGGVPELARRRFSLCLIGLPLLGLEPPLLAGILVGGDVVDALEHLTKWETFSKPVLRQTVWTDSPLESMRQAWEMRTLLR